MSGYPFNPSGQVPLALSPAHVRFYRWPDLSPFDQGYIEAASEAAAVILCRYIGFADWSGEALAMILRDCEVYQSFLTGEYGAETMRNIAIGFWLSRNGEPDAFLEFALDEKALNERARAFPPLTPVLSEDGKVNLVVQAQVGGGE